MASVHCRAPLREHVSQAGGRLLRRMYTHWGPRQGPEKRAIVTATSSSILTVVSGYHTGHGEKYLFPSPFSTLIWRSWAQTPWRAKKHSEWNSIARLKGWYPCSRKKSAWILGRPVLKYFQCFSFEKFYVRNVYRRMKDCVNHPIASVAGATVEIIDRTSNDNFWWGRWRLPEMFAHLDSSSCSRAGAGNQPGSKARAWRKAYILQAQYPMLTKVVDQWIAAPELRAEAPLNLNFEPLLWNFQDAQVFGSQNDQDLHQPRQLQLPRVCRNVGRAHQPGHHDLLKVRTCVLQQSSRGRESHFLTPLYLWETSR